MGKIESFLAISHNNKIWKIFQNSEIPTSNFSANQRGIETMKMASRKRLDDKAVQRRRPYGPATELEQAWRLRVALPRIQER